MSFSDQEMDEFKVEALELLELAEKSLLGLDHGAEFRASFDAAFRCFHSLKGASGMMELHPLQSHTHELENILVKFKEEGSIPKEYINLFLRGIDASRILLQGQTVDFDYSVTLTNAAQADTTVSEESPSSTVLPQSAVDEFVSECNEIIERVSENLEALEANKYTKDTIDCLYRDIHSLKGSAYLFSYNKLGDLAHAMESSLEGIRNGTHVSSKRLLDQLFKGLKLAELIIQKIDTKSSDEDLAMIITIITKALDAAAKGLEQAACGESCKPEESACAEDGGSYLQCQPLGDVVPNPTAAKESEGASSIRVPVSLLDNLMALMGEMVLVRNQVLQFSSKSEDLEFLSMSKRLNAVTSEIQGEMMKTRMQPIGNILNKFTRIVRDLSHELNKNISLNLIGADTELDKSLLEAIKDPLTHIVRNSCDHGIEPSEERLKAGKSEKGHIHIRAYHEGGQVVIDISDDGKGLRKDAIVKKALEKGLISAEKENKLSEKEIFNLIFSPGFSTAAKVTNVSGRGVGMDVVRTNIERIGGTVDLSSVAGVGTTIKIKIPLTLAIIPALIVTCYGSTFAIPQVKLEELVRVDQSSATNKIEILHGAPVLRLRGNILPLVNLNSVLDAGNQNKTHYADGIINIAVLNAEQNSFGLIIDEIQDTADIVVKPLNNLLKSLQIYSGATILGNGAVALILDVLGIAKTAQIGLEKATNVNNNSDRAENANSLHENQDYLLVELNSPTKHALVLGYVHRLEEFRRQDIEYSGTHPVIRYRNSILPLLKANDQLGYGDKAKEGDVIPVVVVQKAGTLFGIEVDRILDTLSTSVEMDSGLIKQPGVFGNLNTKDELIVVIDPFELIARAFPSLNEKAETREAALGRDSLVNQYKGHILVAEDTVFFRRAIKTALEKDGYQVTTATNGQEAMTVLNHSSNHVDLVISDIEMPKMNGFRLAKSIRKHPVYSEVPMVAVSSLADAKHIREGLSAGFNVYLEKLDEDLLLQTVSELIMAKIGRDVA